MNLIARVSYSHRMNLFKYNHRTFANTTTGRCILATVIVQDLEIAAARHKIKPTAPARNPKP
jgi:hypothetical protein